MENPNDREEVTPAGGDALVERHAEMRKGLRNDADVVAAQSLLGMKVMDLSLGKETGTIRDVIFDPKAQRLQGFTVALPGLFAGKRLLPFTSVRGIGRDAVTIPNPEALLAPDEASRLEAAVESGPDVIGKRLLSENGNVLGQVDDVILNRADGQVLGFRISGGVVKDAMGGAHYLPLPNVLTIGEHVITVPAYVEDYVQTDVGGLRPVWEQWKSRASEALAGTRATATGAWRTTRAQASEWQDQARTATGKRLVGRTAGQAVVADDGTVIVSEGQVITPADVDAAEAAGKLGALSRAAIQHNLMSVWSSVRRTTTEATGEARDRVYDVTRDQIVGRTAGFTVTADDGTVIVEEGRVISEDDVDWAEASGTVDTLSASAARGAAEGAVASVAEKVDDLRDRATGRTDEAAPEVNITAEPGSEVRIETQRPPDA